MADELGAIVAAKMRSRRGLVLQAYPSASVLRVVRGMVDDVTCEGGNVVLLFDAPRAMVDRDLVDTWRPLLGNAVVAEPFEYGNAFLGTVGQFNDALRDPDHDDWLDRIALLLVPRGEDLFARPFAWELMAFALRDRFASRGKGNLPRTLVILEPRRAAESAVRDVLPIYATATHAERDSWDDHRAGIGVPKGIWWTVWTSEQIPLYIRRLLPAAGPEFSGATGPLAQFAGRRGVPPELNWVIVDADSGDIDHHQNLQHSARRLLFEQHRSPSWPWLEAVDGRLGVVTVSDTQGNPWRCLHRVLAACSGTTLCNIVSRNELLFVYQATNARSFSEQPLMPLAPKAATSVPFDTAVQLVQRLAIAGSLPAATVRDALVAAGLGGGGGDTHCTDIFAAARHLIASELGRAIADQLRWEHEVGWIEQRGDGVFRWQGRMVLAGDRPARAPVEWLDDFEVVTEAGAVYDVVRREHVGQRYWGGKVLAVEGQKFVVDRVDEATRRVLVTHSDDLESPCYRLERRVEVEFPGDDRGVAIDQRFELPDGASLEVAMVNLDFAVTSSRVVVSHDHWARPPHVETIPQTSRHYTAGRAVRLRFVDRAGNSLLPPGAAVALACWLNEAAVTLLPEVSAFLLAAPHVLPGARPTSTVANVAVPMIETKGDPPGGASVWVFEDSKSDLGIARTVQSDARYLLDICYDWLNWFLDERVTTGGAGGCMANDREHQRDWFAFGEDERDSALALEALRDTLRRYATHFREVSPWRRLARSAPLLSDPKIAAEVVCDICQIVMQSGLPHDVLGDGRVSCRDCSSVGLTSLVALERLYNDVAIVFLREAHGVEDVGNVRVELADQADISQAQGRSFLPTSGFDTRAIGLAVKDAGRMCSATAVGVERHVVMIESGFCAEATVCTLIHELCHVWQFNQLSLLGVDDQTSRLYMEGHAVWTEISLLEWLAGRPGLGFDAERLRAVRAEHEALKSSSSVYGEGFRMLNGHLWRGSAFDWLRRRFPRK